MPVRETQHIRHIGLACIRRLHRIPAPGEIDPATRQKAHDHLHTRIETVKVRRLVIVTVDCKPHTLNRSEPIETHRIFKHNSWNFLAPRPIVNARMIP